MTICIDIPANMKRPPNLMTSQHLRRRATINQILNKRIVLTGMSSNPKKEFQVALWLAKEVQGIEASW